MNYNQWATECPRCHGQDCLTVFEATISSTGEKFHPKSRLFADGFEAGDENTSTEDEKIRCDSCGEMFELRDLALEEN
jgi:uncharacterized protein YbaR (Trm112 family)